MGDCLLHCTAWTVIKQLVLYPTIAASSKAVLNVRFISLSRRKRLFLHIVVLQPTRIQSK